MNKDDIQDELKRIAHRMGELSCEIMKMDNCVSATVGIRIDNILGVANVHIDCKTSEKGSLDNPVDAIPEEAFAAAADAGIPAEELKKQIAEMADRFRGATGSTAEAPPDVNAMLDEILQRRNQGGIN
jgi:hypothetical protein